MYAKNILSEAEYTVKSYDRVGTVLKVMENLHVEHLVVVTGDLFIGVISDVELMDIDADLLLNQSQHLVLTYESCHQSEHILDVYKKFLESGLSVIAVLNDKGRVAGAVSRTELFEKTGELFGVSEPGALIVLRIKKRDYSLAEISRIVEGERNTIVMSLISNEADSEHILCTIKLHSSDIQDIVSSLERYGYEIKATFTEANYEDFLSDRYDQFINYLNV